MPICGVLRRAILRPSGAHTAPYGAHRRGGADRGDGRATFGVSRTKPDAKRASKGAGTPRVHRHVRLRMAPLHIGVRDGRGVPSTHREPSPHVERVRVPTSLVSPSPFTHVRRFLQLPLRVCRMQRKSCDRARRRLRARSRPRTRCGTNTLRVGNVRRKSPLSRHAQRAPP